MNDSTVDGAQDLPRVLVLMASYNGRKYIVEQMDSILLQQDVHVDLVIRDDGSTDDTCRIVEEYAQQHENVDFRRNQANKGVSRNFLDMVSEADADAHDYFAFSDQDDYWMPCKLAKAVEQMEGADDAVLYYSDVCNVDARLQGGSPEYYPFQPLAHNLATVLVTNWAAGCTMVMNPQMVRLLQGFRPAGKLRLHDAWVNMVAISCARCIADLGNSYIKRRITGENVFGQRSFGKIDANRLKGMLGWLFWKSDHMYTLAAEQLLAGYGPLMSRENRELVQTFSRMPKSFPARLRIGFDPRLRMPDSKETLILRARVILNKL